MADQDTAEFLTAWNLREYIPVFRDNGVDLNCLGMLTEDMMKELVLLVGPRSRLKSNIEQWRALLPGYNPVVPPAQDFTPIISVEVPGTSGELNDSVNSTHETQPQGAYGFLSDSQEQEAPVITSTPLQRLELLDFLNSSNEGRSLLSQFQEAGLLDSVGRRRLCNLIIHEEIRDDAQKRVSSARLVELAHQITRIFPKEHTSTYFIPYLTLGHGFKRSAKGKLLDCLNNRKREYRKAGLITVSRLSSRASSLSSSGPPSPLLVALQEPQESDDNPETVLEKLQWLRNSSDPWALVEINWDITAKARLKKVMGLEGPSIAEYMNEYPALKQPSGYLLLQKDFNIAHPDCGGRLYDNLPLYKQRLIQLSKARLVKIKDSTIKNIIQGYLTEAGGPEEASTAAALLCLSFHAGTSTTRAKRTRLAWRPSQQEVRDGFITHVESEVEVQETVTRRREKLSRFGLTVQPFIIIVGVSLHQLTHYIVVVDNTFYKLTSLLEAVDTCFKIIIALNAKWYFIQRGFYGIKTAWDKENTSVNALLSDIGAPSL